MDDQLNVICILYTPVYSRPRVRIVGRMYTESFIVLRVAKYDDNDCRRCIVSAVNCRFCGFFLVSRCRVLWCASQHRIASACPTVCTYMHPVAKLKRRNRQQVVQSWKRPCTQFIWRSRGGGGGKSKILQFTWKYANRLSICPLGLFSRKVKESWRR